MRGQVAHLALVPAVLDALNETVSPAVMQLANVAQTARAKSIRAQKNCPSRNESNRNYDERQDQVCWSLLKTMSRAGARLIGCAIRRVVAAKELNTLRLRLGLRLSP